jgi:hypothetical protein
MIIQIFNGSEKGVCCHSKIVRFDFEIVLYDTEIVPFDSKLVRCDVEIVHYDPENTVTIYGPPNEYLVGPAMISPQIQFSVFIRNPRRIILRLIPVPLSVCDRISGGLLKIG